MTNKGQAVLDRAKALFGAVEEFRSEVNSLAGRLIGDLHIGAVDNIITNEHSKVSKAIDRFRKRNQQVSLTLTVSGPVDFERAVIDDRIHLAIGYFGRRLELLNYEELFQERQVLYCARNSFLFEKAPDGVSRRDIERADWVARGYPLGEDLRSYAPPATSATASHMEAIAMLILSGHHIGYLPDHFAKAWVASGRLRPVLPKTMAYDAAFHLITRKGRRQRRILHAFVQDLREAHGRSD